MAQGLKGLAYGPEVLTQGPGGLVEDHGNLGQGQARLEAEPRGHEARAQGVMDKQID